MRAILDNFRHLRQTGRHPCSSYSCGAEAPAGSHHRRQYAFFLDVQESGRRESSAHVPLKEASMDLRKLKKLIDLVEDSGIAELEVTEGEEKVKIVKGGGAGKEVVVLSPSAVPMAVPAPQAVAPAAASVAPAAATAAAPTALEGHIIKSPMVGTFYRAGSP